MAPDTEARLVPGLTGPATALVTGASSGIGLALVHTLLDHRGIAEVVAVSRRATGNPGLAALRDRHGDRLRCIDADLTRDDDLASLAVELQAVGALHVVVNAAGLLHDATVAPEKALEQLSRASLERVFALNAFAPILLAQALMPLLCRGQPAVFASLSARVGSIGDNRAGGWYAYRASKAAQNQLMRTFAIEWKRRNRQGIALSLHPGTVDTPLSAPFRARVPPDRLFDPRTAAHRLLEVIAARTPADSGHFFAWDGTEIPW
ncbi:SDR family NAD(P)-dependent oxidoreductase [Lysobacter xanthus]